MKRTIMDNEFNVSFFDALQESALKMETGDNLNTCYKMARELCGILDGQSLIDGLFDSIFGTENKNLKIKSAAYQNKAFLLSLVEGYAEQAESSIDESISFFKDFFEETYPELTDDSSCDDLFLNEEEAEGGLL